MTLISLIIALLLEQLRPLGNYKSAKLFFTRYANHLERSLNAGTYKHGILAWCFAVVPALIISVLIYVALYTLSPILAIIWNIVILYLTMGFRQFSNAFSRIAKALLEGKGIEARQQLSDWTGQPCADLSDSDVAKRAIEQGITQSYQHVFGTMFWFLILPGPSGAILYRFSLLLNQKWGKRPSHIEGDGEFGKFSNQISFLLNWIPIRLTAFSFAVMGDFEGAISCWRSLGESTPRNENKVLLSAASGALGIRLDDPTLPNEDPLSFSAPQLSDDITPHYLQSAIGLVWRSTLLWLVIVFLLNVASYIG